MDTSMTGRCLCGAVTFRAKPPASGVHVCHCSDCARWVGGPFLGVTFDGGVKASGPVNWFKSSEHGERGSCGTCGSALFLRMQDGSFFTVTAGSLDERAGLDPIEEHIFIEGKPGFYDFAGDAPRLTGQQVIERIMAANPGLAAEPRTE